MSLGKIKVDAKNDGGKWYQFEKSGSFISPPDVIYDIPDDGWHVFPSVNCCCCC